MVMLLMAGVAPTYQWLCKLRPVCDWFAAYASLSVLQPTPVFQALGPVFRRPVRP